MPSAFLLSWQLVFCQAKTVASLFRACINRTLFSSEFIYHDGGQACVWMKQFYVLWMAGDTFHWSKQLMVNIFNSVHACWVNTYADDVAPRSLIWEPHYPFIFKIEIQWHMSEQFFISDCTVEQSDLQLQCPNMCECPFFPHDVLHIIQG